MKITGRTSLRGVAIAVGQALADHGIRAVLTGGACASIYSRGSYLSEDVDFVLEGRVDAAVLDEAMAGIGFRREATRYVHSASRFWVEFPRGPLAVGRDLGIQPSELRGSGERTLALSPTDSCRDRLAAFFHWDDRQSLSVAVEIASHHPVDLDLIGRWSASEGNTDRFQEFREALSSKEARRIPAGKR